MQVRIPFKVEPNYRGWRLDAYLAQKIRRLTPEKLAFVIANRLEHDGEGALGADTLLAAGQEFRLVREVEPEPETPMEFAVVHDDGALLVVDKPAGLPVHPTARYFTNTFTSLAKLRFPDRKIDPAHRLDRETSGLLACGSAPAHTKRLKAAFAAGRVEKAYLAIVEGSPREDRFLVDAPLSLTLASLVRVRMHVHDAGAPAVTAFEVLGRRVTPDGAPVALLACAPRTGRQHQIRAHLHHAGLALVGDKIYGHDEAIFDRFTRRELTDHDHARLRLPRQALHAWRLALPHPLTGDPVALEAPLAPDLAAFWERCAPEAADPGR